MIYKIENNNKDNYNYNNHNNNRNCHVVYYRRQHRLRQIFTS